MPSCYSNLSLYEPQQIIGSGGFGQIVRVRRKSDRKEYVWKELKYGKMNTKDRAQVVAEVNILRSLRPHPHIVRYCDRIVDKASSRLFIVMEYCRGGDLASLIRRHRRENVFMREDFVWKMLAQIASALKQCHRSSSRQQILHRDLKPANILLDRDMNAKLCDFGLAHVLAISDTDRKQNAIIEAKATGMSMGTPCYMSPERVNNCKYDERSDVWSLGCIIYELCALVPPFEAPDHSTLVTTINSGVIAPVPLHFSKEMHHTCAWLLRHDVSRRPRVEDIESLPPLQLYLREIQCTMREMTYREKKQKLLRDVSQRETCVKVREEKMLNEVADTHSRLRTYAKKLLKWERELMAKSSLINTTTTTHQVMDSDSDELSDDDGFSSPSMLSLPTSYTSISSNKEIDIDALLLDDIFLNEFSSPSFVSSNCNRATPDIIDTNGCQESSINVGNIYISQDQQKSGKAKIERHRSNLSREISYESIPSNFCNQRKRLLNDERSESLVVSLSTEELPSSPNKRQKL